VYFKRDPGAITFIIYLYDAQASILLYVLYNSTVPALIFTPTYIGLAVNTTNRLYLDAAFDDFLFAPGDPAAKRDVVVQAYLGYGSNVTTGPLFNITIYPGETRYTYLWLDQTNSAIPSTLYLNLTLVNAAGAASTKIQVHGGLVVSDTTSAIPLSGTGNYVHIEGYFTQPTQSATLRLYIVACTSPTLAVCYVVKVTVYLSTIE
jgi:hypothetical protein